MHKAQVGADIIRPKEERKKKKEEWWAGHPLVQTNFAREKGSRANLLSLLHLFLLSPKSLLRNTFRGPRYRSALLLDEYKYDVFILTALHRPL